ncbi:MAG: hypothetical protein A3A96_01040 [Candidatus Zambryskibacteria bacterium RIFCSPLOWO2_01_FULL_39_39]|uniref:Glycosyl transferase family 1 domain-containing protein n=1 Tax=Candidatus Zambryskibacteria bacterium RIFCSPLOWO2_01_FULL_39_39 TaxID=1802758 RepID=A0A1G2TZ50_9BACT|nr:MAG: Glycosyl transferase group 1 [Parcubacteria group bacterium GW2011_GWA1_38_7]OHA87543.1 MAG: hypothetical protein A2644_04340 [Candidatus Zambryskibacteria bacterium RIFCSPHIGHO2_01_FULL_39_63]OHA95071.1 MAG: hypothetical protein A3B88_03250 [Candidatus Zambryskibacteria bacterium RIFCSPHIGHO2_02_FULL_39_19]OHA98191.1 MAG: hypothetical protein A3F20_04060 [Candidatus Zambryskibacteria bacterium RIFCSPHIGHO2_12_FULL_39_21]OHB02443.1 MAG: hypothetical protein A3A96_01040 [Candidatus Zambr
MQLVYLTSKKYPSSTADHFFVRNMAEVFSKILSEDFTFIVRQTGPELKSINVKVLYAPSRVRTVYYFFSLPFFIFRRHNCSDCFFFSNDPYLLSVLIFWRKIFGFKYKICSDWHQIFQDWRDGYIANNSDFLISTSERLKDLIIKKTGLQKNKIFVAYGGVDLSKFNPNTDIPNLRKQLNLPLDCILVGYVGFYKTMGMSKGVDMMIESLRFIPDKKVKMVFVGGKPNEIEEYQSLAIKNGVEDRCIFLGVVSQELVPKYEQTMDMLVIPYPDKPHFRDWGFPMKVYEYMASKKPIIYSNLPIIGEVLEDCAISFEPDNPRDLADKIEKFNSEPKEGIDWAEKALEKVKNFTWQKRAEKITNFLTRN